MSKPKIKLSKEMKAAAKSGVTLADRLVAKTFLDDLTTPLTMDDARRQNLRGITAFHATTFWPVSGKTKEGETLTGNIEYPYYLLSPTERVEVVRQHSTVFGLVTGRMNRISAFEWDIIPEYKKEDETEYYAKCLRARIKELGTQSGLAFRIASARLYGELNKILPDCFPDLSNFDAALLRRKRRIQSAKKRDCEEVEAWLREPNIHDDYEEFVKTYVYDMLTHGVAAIYKEYLSGRLENFYVLPGGSVFPLRARYVGGYEAYAQVIYGYPTQIFFQDEISFDRYVPSSARAYGWVPVEALVNKVTEGLMFDKLMAEQADGTRPPEKVLIFGSNKDPYDPMSSDDQGAPIPEEENRRIEKIFNEKKKYSVRSITGYGTPFLLDMSKENTMDIQMRRQDQLDKAIALAFNATNNEINQTGSEGTSGRSTSEVNSEIDHGKGVMPMLIQIENFFNKDIIEMRYGPGYCYEYKKTESEKEKMELYQTQLSTGLYSVNEIRVKELNEDPFPDSQFDFPAAAVPKAQGQSESNPLFVQNARR